MGSAPSPIQRVLEGLQHVRKSGERQWEARCPAHDDKSPSLSVTVGNDGKVVLHCHVGCTVDEVTAAIGMTVRDLFPPRQPDGPAFRTEWRFYDYHDADGRLLYQVARIPKPDGGKGFTQRRPARPDDPSDKVKSGFVWNLNGVQRTLYRLPEALAAAKAGQRVYVVEGEKDVDRLRSLGLTATCNSGGAADKRPGRPYKSKWKPRFSQLLAGADVVVIPDNDPAGAAHAESIARMTAPVTAVRIVRLPGLGDKGDVTDWLNAGGTVEELERLVEAGACGAPPKRTPDGGEPAKPLEYDSDVALAQRFLADVSAHGPPLVHDAGELHRYDSKQGVWTPLVQSVLRRQVAQFDRRRVITGRDEHGEVTTRPIRLSKGRVHGIASLVVDFASQPGFFAAPPAGVAFANGFVTLLGSDEPTVETLTPGHRCRTVLPFDYEPAAPVPRWTQFLIEVLQPDADKENTAKQLQEFFGACLLGVAPRYERCLVLDGVGANGKSVMLEVLAALFPADSRCVLSPQDFGRDFRLAALAGKRVNVVNEVPDTDVASSERFKAVVSGQELTAEHKNRDPFTFRPQAGHVFACNTLPGTRDATPGFWRRFMVVPMMRVFEEHEQERGLGQRLIKEELPGIAAWAVEGAARLARQDHYTISKTSAEAKEEWQLKADRVRLWVHQRCAVVDRKAGTAAGQLYDDFRQWCSKNGFGHMTSTTFGERLELLGHARKSVRLGGGKTAKRRPLKLRPEIGGGGELDW